VAAVGEGKVGFAPYSVSSEKRMFGKTEAGLKVSKSESNVGSAGASPLCPSCSPKVTKVYRDGLRYLKDKSTVQRWLCRDCGFRFSEKPTLKGSPPLQETSERSLNTCSALASKRQICALGAKNLSATEVKTVAGDKKKPLKLDLLPETMRGYIVQFTEYLERNGFDEENTYPAILTRLVADGADLLDSENVKAVIAKKKKANGEPWSGSMKMIAACAYDAFCHMQKVTWERPIYYQDEIEIIVPDEKDLDLLISAASKRMATFLLCLKETFADPSEVLACKWSEFKDNVLYINHPVKRHYSGHYELSARLVYMINALPRENERIFPMRYRIVANTFRALRRKVAKKFSNPAVLQISLKSFRHWGGSMLAYVTNGNVPEIARVLRHRSWKSTQRYVHTIMRLRDEDFDVTSATTLDEILALGKAGWQKYDEVVFKGVTYHCYRKPKRFGALRKNDVDTSKTEGIRYYPHEV